jgi:hypothetical protein
VNGQLLGKPAPYDPLQHLVQAAGHLTGSDPPGGRGVKPLLLGGDDVHGAELHALVWAHDRIGKRASRRFFR